MIALYAAAYAADDQVEIGSYGRVQVSTDATGGQGEPAQVVAYGSRLEEQPYVELEVSFDHAAPTGPGFRVVVTPAIDGDLFHYSQQWDASLALRNLYAEISTPSSPWTVWAGSRMYRGDDVYLLDFWPLDDLNTVGGGAIWKPDGWRIAGHVGLSRLASGDYELQTRPEPVAGGVGVEDVAILDRQRAISSFKVDRIWGSGVSERLTGYAELHYLPAGQRLHDDQFVQPLPSDAGSVIGAEWSVSGWAQDSFVHVWARRATGLAAFGDSVPGGLGTDYRARGASEELLAIAANHELGQASVQLGAYVRRFDDADENRIDVDDRWESNLAVRPTWFPAPMASVGVELSQQWLRPDGLDPRTSEHDVPLITKIAVLPAIQPRPGSFARPQVRLQYVFSYLNDDARSWFAPDDPRHASNYQHFVGVGAEWWLNSQSSPAESAR